MRLRLPIVLLVLTCALTTTDATVSAQEWARKMFTKRSHDFGAVARGSKTEFRFELTNLYKEDVHLASVRTSCGCTTPRIEKATLKSLEKGAIVAKFNTNSFLGAKNATVTVTIDRPFFAEVQLQVSGYIRSDVVFQPGEVQFGEIEQGKPTVKRVKIDYAGSNNWKITDIRSASEHLEVELNQGQRGNGRVSYDMVVRLLPNAPSGYLKAQLALITNEGTRQTITLPVAARISSALSVRPKALLFGDVSPGDRITKKLVVHGKQPFIVTNVACKDKRFEFQLSDKAKKVHIIPVKFSAGDSVGKVSEKILIKTDKGLAASSTLSAEVR